MVRVFPYNRRSQGGIGVKAQFGIIGGTGVYEPDLLEDLETIDMDTPYGPAVMQAGTYRGRRIAFLPRHGPGHQTPPHRVNYRANIWALKELGVTQVLATAAVGSLQPDIAPGSLVIVDNFLDFTKTRPVTFFESGRVVHVDMTDPYCGRLRQALAKTARRLGLAVRAGGTYVCVEGPRFETTAEIRLFQAFGGHVVGMTSVPEVVLAKEAELCYATVCMVTNYGAGIGAADGTAGAPEPLTHQEVLKVMGQSVHRIRELFLETIAVLGSERPCRCPQAVSGQAPLGQRHGDTGDGKGEQGNGSNVAGLHVPGSGSGGRGEPDGAGGDRP
ncbi:MAG: S-methyl-5'-thioadenosine phosphorylase [Alicyclobacillaceae bacterium]|nr:S-methyl-5'-thioadenosine phosphorylase [Alicyclobacillaceae bacterium]